ncbi:hypothetical protein E4U53_003500 [Claviceps sorghi]|nr:hypothetical protein E4U53_003500 [Claviceps sorghi]
MEHKNSTKWNAPPAKALVVAANLTNQPCDLQQDTNKVKDSVAALLINASDQVSAVRTSLRSIRLVSSCGLQWEDEATLDGIRKRNVVPANPGNVVSFRPVQVQSTCGTMRATLAISRKPGKQSEMTANVYPKQGYAMVECGGRGEQPGIPDSEIVLSELVSQNSVPSCEVILAPESTPTS